VSQCATGPARKSRVCPGRPRVEENKPVHLLLRPLSVDSAPSGVMNTVVTRGGNEVFPSSVVKLNIFLFFIGVEYPSIAGLSGGRAPS